MQFIGRRNELRALERHFQSQRFEFLVVYGRRRVGKSTLLRRFIENKKAVYFMSLETDNAVNIRNLSRAIQFGLSEPEGAVFPDYQTAFEYLFERSHDERIVVIFDEYPFAARADRSLASVLQRLIDLHHDRSKMMLILCGSSISYMEEEVLAYRSPLYGRRTGQLRVEPFDFFDARQLLPHRTPEESALLYGAVGGTPLYLQQVGESGSIDEVLKNTWLSSSSFFSEEPITFLRQETRTPETYFSAIQAIADGASRLNEIATRLQKESAATVGVLRTLMLLGIVARETPYGEKQSRRSLYRIADNMFRFWFTFVAPNSSILVRGDTEDVVLQRIAPQFSMYMEPIFEEICREYLLRELACGRTPVFFTSLGRWWGTNPETKREEEIDLMGEENKQKALFAECKWTNARVDVGVLETLENRSRRLFRHSERYLYLFSRSGFTDACRRRAAELSNVKLVTFAEMVEEIPFTD